MEFLDEVEDEFRSVLGLSGLVKVYFLTDDFRYKNDTLKYIAPDIYVSLYIKYFRNTCIRELRLLKNGC